MKNQTGIRWIWILSLSVAVTAGCDNRQGGGVSGASSGSVSGSSLNPSDRAEVMELLRAIYRAGLGERIVAWYRTEARGYFDHRSQELVEFPAPITTLSIAVPEFVTATQPVEEQLTTLASKTILNGWRLTKFKVEVRSHGAGGGPSGYYDKITIYPIEVQKQ